MRRLVFTIIIVGALAFVACAEATLPPRSTADPADPNGPESPFTPPSAEPASSSVAPSPSPTGSAMDMPGMTMP
jgi:hypothetical protein